MILNFYDFITLAILLKLLNIAVCIFSYIIMMVINHLFVIKLFSTKIHTNKIIKILLCANIIAILLCIFCNIKNDFGYIYVLSMLSLILGVFNIIIITTLVHFDI